MTRRLCLFPILAVSIMLPIALEAQAAAGQAAPAASAVQATTFADQITGTVSVDGLAVPGVTVTVTDPASGQKYVTSTDESGRFSARVGHPGEFDISTAMAAFAPAQSKVTVPASAAPLAPVQIALLLASDAPVQAVAPASPNATNRRPAGVQAAANRPGLSPSTAGRSRAVSTGGGRSGRGAAAGGFQQLDVNQTGELSGDLNAGADNSGVAGMNDSAATDSTVVTGQASQDERPMGADAIQSFLRENGMAGGGGFGAPGGGGRGGFGGGGGFRGGFNMRQMQNRFNQPHGNLSYTLSDSALNALPDSLTSTTATQNPPNAANQRYSATVTMPFKIPHVYDDKGKTSITASFNGRHDSNLSSVTGLVPTANERAGNFQGVTDRSGNPVTIINPSTGQPYGSNTILPGDISSSAQALLAFVPLPTPGATGRFNYSNTLNALNVTNSVSLRVNHSFGAPQQGGRGRFGRGGRNLNFSLNYSGGHGEQPGVFFPFFEGLTKTRGINVRAGYTQPLFGWINNASVSYNRNRNDVTNLYAGVKNVAADAGIQGVATNSLDWGVPSISFATSGLTSLRDTAPNFVRSQTFSISDSMIRRKGKHNVRFGGDYRREQNNPDTDQTPRGSFSFDGQYSGYDFADFLLGKAQQDSLRYGGGVFYFRQVQPDLYFNDNWQMKSSFTLNYGVRWEYISPNTELFNRLTNLLVGPNFSSVTPVVAGQNGVPATVLKPEYGHLRPSLGFAWKSWANMIVTGGFGMAYNTGAYGNMATALAYQSPFIINQANLGTNTTALNLANGFGGPGASLNTYGVNPDYQVGYSYLWNLDVQRQLGRSYVLNVDYSGSEGTGLDQLRAPNRTPTGLLNPNLPVFLYDTTGANSIYHGGTLILSRRLSRGVSFRGSYTYSKMLDDASQIGGGGGANGLIAQNDLNLAAERALSSQNQTHRVSLSYEWQLPYGLNHKWGDSSSFWSSAFGDWQLSGSLTAASGQPFTPTVSNVFSNAQGLQALGVNVPLRANVVSGQTVAAAAPTLTHFFNTAAFAAPASGAYGDAGRDTIIGPGQIVFNTSLSKSFRIGEFRNLELRFDGNNALNHPNWAGIDSNLNSATFGSVTGFSSPRQITFTSRFRF